MQDSNLSSNQTWFVLVWLSALSFLGGAALVMGEHPEYAGWVFAIPLVLLFCWGLAKYIINRM
jgi:hypothetical protein